MSHELRKDERNEYGELPPDRLDAMPDDQLLAEFQNSLALSARALVYSASLYGVLRKRGREVTGLRGFFAAYLPRIVAGEVVPEVLVAFSGATNAMIGAVTRLPREQQRQLATDNGLRVSVVEKATTGEFTERMVKVTPDWKADLVKQVFAEGGIIRTPDEQRAMLQNALPLRETGKKSVRVRKVTVDTARDEVTIGRSDPAPVKEVIEALVKAGYIDPPARTRAA
jgi:hypothetical protein